MKFKFKVGKMYYFKWHDASQSQGWRTQHEALAANPSIIENVGFYMGESDKEYIFCGDHDVNANLYNNLMYRPKGNMLNAREIK